jgi:hypothetical protein
MKWPLKQNETLGVVAVGFALAALSNTATTRVQGRRHATAMLVSGAVLYTLGVAIGASRPPQGWLEG